MQLRERVSAIGNSLKEVLLDAQQHHRLTCGIYDSGKLLSKSPDSVMMCILPEDSSSDVTLHIHFTLIEAFCWENDIRIIKVDSVDKLRKLLSVDKDDEMTDPRWPPTSLDYNCVLIEYPQQKLSVDEEILIEFFKMSCDISPQPIIELEV
jgi:growth arrest and DNA-damage-inducible protein